jgi:hypothetical protein
VFHCPCPIKVDEVPIMRLQYASYFLPVLILFGRNSNAEVTCQKLLLVPLGMWDFIATQCF